MVAEAAVVPDAPARRGLEPVDVARANLLQPGSIERAEDFRTGQLWLYGARLADRARAARVRRAAAAARCAAPVRAGRCSPAPRPAAALSVDDHGRDPAGGGDRAPAGQGRGTGDAGLVGYAGDVVKAHGDRRAAVGAGGALLVFGIRRFGPALVDAGDGVVVASA